MNNRASATATMIAAPTVTAAALEAQYQKAIANINIGRWQEARAELEAIFEVDPTYKDIQARLIEVYGKLAELQPTVSLPTPIPSPSAIVMEDFSGTLDN